MSTDCSGFFFSYSDDYSEIDRELMHPKVRDLYKKLIFIGKYQYPFDNFPILKERFRQEILKHRDLSSDSIEFKKKIAFGRYQLREMQAAGHLHKYRMMKKRYYSPEEKE